RLDFVVDIAALDRNGTERLVRAVVAPGKLDPTVDFDEVYKNMEKFEPAFVRATADRAKTFALTRAEGKPDYVLTTKDLVSAAVPAPAARTAAQGLRGHPRAGDRDGSGQAAGRAHRQRRGARQLRRQDVRPDRPRGGLAVPARPGLHRGGRCPSNTGKGVRNGRSHPELHQPHRPDPRRIVVDV